MSLRNFCLACCFCLSIGAHAAQQPNIVVMLSDNLGFGDLGSYGGGAQRGAATPQLDQLAAQGFRFTNFMVESECTPSRSALMTGRLPIRSGTTRAIPVPGLPQGLAPWEVTIAEVLSKAGYNTAMYGKWHLGYQQDRLPTAQGFKQWWGFPFSTGISDFPNHVGFEQSGLKPARLWEGSSKDGAKPTEVYDRKMRPYIDEKIASKAVNFIQETNKEEPFFLYVPWSLPHHPSIPHPDFQGKTGHGRYADVLAEHDHRVGQVLAAIDAAGIADNTIVIYASDNGPDRAEYPWIGDTGPFRGYLGTVHEGSVRTPMFIRWPEKIKPGQTSNEIVSMVDIFSSVAALASAQQFVPDDRVIDGKDMSDFWLGKQAESGRDSVILFSGEDLRAVKWRQFKIYFQGEGTAPGQQRVDQLWAPEVYNTVVDPKETNNIGVNRLWTLSPAFKTLMPFAYSVDKYGLVEPGGDKPSRFEVKIPFFRWSQIENSLGEIKKQRIKQMVKDKLSAISQRFQSEDKK